MRCMKCGRETAGTHAFCDECLTEMEKHPIRSDTPIHLPQRPAREKTPARVREQTPADTIHSLRGLVRWLIALITILSILLCATAGFLLHTLEKESKPIGRNYTTSTTDTNP